MAPEAEKGGLKRAASPAWEQSPPKRRLVLLMGYALADSSSSESGSMSILKSVLLLLRRDLPV